MIVCESYVAGYLKNYYTHPESVSEGASQAALGFIYIIAFGWAIGLDRLPYLFGGAELWPNRIRSFGGALSQYFHRLFYFTITKVTPSLLSAMDQMGCICLFCDLWLHCPSIRLFLLAGSCWSQLGADQSHFERPLWRLSQPLDPQATVRRMSHVWDTPALSADVSTRIDVDDLPPEFPDIRVDLPRSDLLAEGIGINTTDMVEFFS